MSEAREWVTEELRQALRDWNEGKAYPQGPSDIASIHNSLHSAMDLSDADKIEEVIIPLGVALSAWKNGSDIGPYREQMERSIKGFAGQI